LDGIPIRTHQLHVDQIKGWTVLVVKPDKIVLWMIHIRCCGSWTWASLDLKSWAVLDLTTEAGREFQSGMFLGNNVNFM